MRISPLLRRQATVAGRSLPTRCSGRVGSPAGVTNPNRRAASACAGAFALATILASGCGIAAGRRAEPGRVAGGPASSPPSAAVSVSDGSAMSASAPRPRAAAAPAHPIAQVGFYGHGEVPTVGGAACGCVHGGQAGACGPSGCPPSTVCPPDGGAAVCPPNLCPPNQYGIDPQEFICDGGDHDPRATLRRDDSIAGLQPEDTVVHYTTEAGDIEFEASNRTCLYAPRFLSVRKVTGAVADGRAIGLSGFDRPVGPGRVAINEGGVLVTDTLELKLADVARRIDAMRERNRGVPIEGILQPEQATDVLAALAGLTVTEMGELRDEEIALLEELALAAVVWTLDEQVEVVIEDLNPPTLTRDQRVEAFTIYDFPDAGRLRVCKLADRHDALPGEIVNFAIRVENVGDSAVDHVVLTDNLTTRLEYVEGSQTCSGGAEFETTVNEGQSLKLQWKLTDKLRVGESVTMRFRCKVR